MNYPRFIFILLLGLCLVVFFLFLRVYKHGISAVLAKAYASLFFVLVGLSASFFSYHRSDVKFAVIAGLLFGMLGDIWLDLKVIYTKDLKFWLCSGFVFFMAGHLFYAAAIVWSARMSISSVVLSVAIGIILGNLTVSLEKIMKLNYGAYKTVSRFYSTTLFSTFICALTACLKTAFQNTTLCFLFLGILFFLISDVILSATYFGNMAKQKPTWILSNHIAYYIAQYLIASSILFL